MLPKTIRYYEQIRYRAGTCFALPLVTVTTIDQHLTDSSSSFRPLLAVSPNSVVVTEPEFRWPSVRNSMAAYRENLMAAGRLRRSGIEQLSLRSNAVAPMTST